MGSVELRTRERAEPAVKKLFVPDGFAGLGDDSVTYRKVFSEREAFEIRKMFESTGCVVLAGESDYQDGSFGILSDPPYPASHELRRNLADAIGLREPRLFPVTEAEKHLPAVAKYPKLHKGNGIFLIENRVQLARLKAKMFIEHTTMTRLFPVGTPNFVMARQVLSHVLSDTIHPDAEESLRRVAMNYPLEEYIETPGDFDASFRIVADGHGELHYGALIRSPMRKGHARRVKTREIDPRNKWNRLLEDPFSPLFLKSKKIVSNEAQGGLLIMLNGESVTDIDSASVLLAHGLNPECPRVPVRMLEAASRIGVLSRAMFPYVGVDFIMDKNDMKTPVLLEVNAYPVIYPTEIGIADKIPESYSLDVKVVECMMEMMQRVANFKPVF